MENAERMKRWEGMKCLILTSQCLWQWAALKTRARVVQSEASEGAGNLALSLCPPGELGT